MKTSGIPKHDVFFIRGDMNAKVGSDNSGVEDVMGKNGIGIRNNNTERLIDFCLKNNLTVGGSMFKHKDIHTMTLTSPNGRVKYQIDHILINRK